jgi:YggT family protein
VPTFLSAADGLLGVLRLVVFAAGVAVAALAALSAAVRARRLSPFGTAGRLARSTADPLFAPMERTLLRAGGQPSHAPWWTLAAVVVGGLALISLVGFVVQQTAGLAYAASAGPRGIGVLLVSWAFSLLRVALLVRVLGTWVGQGPYSPWTRWAYRLTDWFMRPLQQVVPTLGPIDITPIVAYFGLGLLQSLVARVLL